MKIDALSWNETGARYGYNGKEKDNEVKGDNNSLDFGARIYDPRVSRFLSQDPLAYKYPEVTPYMFAADNPIIYIDVNGEHPGKAFRFLYNSIEQYIKNKNDKALERIQYRTKQFQDANPNKQEPLTHKTQVYIASYAKSFGDLVGLDNLREAQQGLDLDGNEVSTGARVVAGVFIAIDVTPFGKLIPPGIKSRLSHVIDFGKAAVGDVVKKGFHIKIDGNHFLIKLQDDLIGLVPLEKKLTEANTKTAAKKFSEEMVNNSQRSKFLNIINKQIETVENTPNYDENLLKEMIEIRDKLVKAGKEVKK